MTEPTDPVEPRTPQADAPADAEATPLSAEPVFTKADLDAACEAAAADAKDRLMRLAAEYDNFRRRVQKEKEALAAEAIERFAADLLLVLDDFDRALVVKTDSVDAVKEGVRLTDQKLRAAFARHGIECVDPAGQKFDPRLHEAIQRVAAADRAPGSVVQVFEKGYTLKGRLLRPARVVVAGDA